MSQSDELRQFTKAELFEHCNNNADRVVLAIHQNIYDVTPFLDEHPGGEEPLKEHTIKDNKFIDATEAFEDVGHSADARDFMKKFLIGKLATGKQSEPKNVNASSAQSAGNQENSQSSGFNWYWLLSFVTVIGAAILYRRFKLD